MNRGIRNMAVVGVVAAVLWIVGLLLNSQRAMESYLFAFVLWASLAIGCLGIQLMHHTVGGQWGFVIRWLYEAGSRTAPLLFVLWIPIVLASHALYPWARPSAAQDAVIQAKAAYLNLPFFIVRSVVYFAIWTFYAYFMSRRPSQNHDASDDLHSSLHGAHRAESGRLLRRSVAAPGLILLVFTATFAFVDWCMSLEPGWYSTIYGAVVLVGQVLQAFVFLTAILVYLARQEPVAAVVKDQHFHDLGNMIFAFTVLWAYLAFSQFLIIWSGNLPEETQWYVSRFSGAWNWVALFLVIFHFAIPFVLLLQRDMKRRRDLLLRMCVFMFIVRIVDMYWTVMPAFFPHGISMSWMDVAALIGIGGIWGAFFFWQLERRPVEAIRIAMVAGRPKETVVY